MSVVVTAGFLQAVPPSPTAQAKPSAPKTQAEEDPAPARPAPPARPRQVGDAVKNALKSAPKVSWPTAASVDVPVSATTKASARTAAPARATTVGGLVVTAAPTTTSAKAEARSLSRPEAVRPTKIRVETLDRGASARAKVDGPVLRVSRNDGVGASGQVRLTLSYAGVADAFGGDFGARLSLVKIADCAGRPAGDAACLPQPVPTVNDAEARTLTATVQAGTAATTYAMTATESSAQGNYGATELTPSSKWSVSPSNGAFNWSYPMRVPPVPGGANPSIVLSYNSQTVDGRTAATNNQGSWIGEGFGYDPGYVERQYKPCTEDGHDGVGDLCWSHENLTLMLNGRSSELVQDGTGWRFSSDDGSKIRRETGAVNGDERDGEYWVVTTTDGAEYYFGMHRLPGWVSGKEETNSVWTVPVYGDDNGEQCYNSTFTSAWCQQGWRWNLDYVKDRNGNVVSYFYDRETNYYARNAKFDVNGTAYHRGGYLKRIDYGQRHNEVYTTNAAARVAFGIVERCIPSGTMLCNPGDLNDSTANHWPDVPWDRNCPAATKCKTTQASPSFWTRKRVTQITTEIRNATAWSPVDAWKLDHNWTNNADGSRSLWLTHIRHEGVYGGGTPITVPSVQLDAVQLPNRIDKAGDNILPLIRPRLNTVWTDSGGQITVRYEDADCTADTLPTPGTSTKRCYPVMWHPGGATDPVTDWFHKYVVKTVTESDMTTVVPGTSIAPDMVTEYEYLGDAAWRHGEPNGITEAKYLTWNQWRGYEKVRIRKGSEQLKTTLTEHHFLRGMHGDKLPASAGGGTRTETRTDSVGTTHTDHDQFAGFEFETKVYDGSKIISKSVATPWRQETASKTWTWGTDRAWMVKPSVNRGFTLLEDGSWRETKSVTTYDVKTASYTDPVGRVTQVEDLGDVSTPADDRCTRTTYADSATPRLRTLVAREETVAVACSATPNRATQVLSDARTSYDGLAFGATPTRGNATKVEKLSSHDGTTASYVTVGESTFDKYGRPDTAKDISGALTTITYTETNGLTTKKVEKSPTIKVAGTDTNFSATTEFHPAWGQPTVQLDWNNRRTDVEYDKLGRVTGVWLPDRAKASTPTAPSVRYSYIVETSKPIAVKTESLDNSGVYVASYEIYDGLLRPRQTQSPGPDGGRMVAETYYTATGQAGRVNDSYYAAGAPSGQLLPTLTGDTDLQSEYVYDGADRVTNAITLVAGEEKWRTVTSYGGDRTHVDPPTGATPTTTITDARGQVRALRQYKGAGPSGEYDETTYTYTAAGQPETVKDAANNIWRYAYDQRGRKISAVDPDTGTTIYEYNGYDQLTSTVNAENVRVSYAYDVLGRKTATYQGDVLTGTKLTEFVFDTVAKGQLYSSTRYVGALKYQVFYPARDAFNRATEVRYSIPKPTLDDKLGGVYRFHTAYNNDGTVRNIGFPAAGGLAQESVTYTYDSLQRVTNITGSGTAGQQSYVTGTKYAQTGELQQVELNTGGRKAWGTYFYEEGTKRLSRSMLTRQVIVAPGQPEPTDPPSDIDQQYTYDQAGNVLSVADTPANGQRDIQCFNYDYLRRLTEAWSTGSTVTDPCAGGPATSGVSGAAPYHHSYTYDVTGNRLTETQHAAGGSEKIERIYGYPDAGQPQPHTVRSVTEKTSGGDRLYSYEYDKVGNTTKRTQIGEDQSLVWDAEGHLASATKNGQTTSFIYDADGNRMVRKEPNATTVYLPGMELRLDHATNVVDGTRFYQVTDKMSVVRTVSGLQFQATDRHGTGQAAVDATSGQLTYRRSTPFGTPRGNQPGAGEWLGEKGFVGGTKDESTGLTHLGAREYDPLIGRFISVDPIIDPADPQQMHGYSYAVNNPLTFSDANGLKPLATDGGAAEDKYWKDRPDQKLTQDPKSGKWTVIKVTPKKPRPSEPPEVTRARQEAERAKQIVIAIAKELGKIIADELGITDAMDCFIKGDMGACAMTALNVVLTAVGGAAGKLLARYAFRLDKLNDLKNRLWDLGGRLKEAVTTFFRSRKRADEMAEAAADTCEVPWAQSFVPGTLVLMADGSKKKIEDLEPGDHVRAEDPKTGKSAAKAVVATWTSRSVKDLVRITVDIDGDHGDATDEIVATAVHPFWVDEIEEWVNAQALTPGQSLLTPSGDRMRIAGVKHWSETTRVHNLTVDDIHTYYVVAGERAVLVHNCGSGTISDKQMNEHILPRHDPNHPDYGKWYKKSKFDDWVTPDHIRNWAKLAMRKPVDKTNIGTGVGHRHVLRINSIHPVGFDKDGNELHTIAVWVEDGNVTSVHPD
ncbi:polymorphic toxin-type HINT domain-containing protein [Micromonospora citrea]|uniref:polymorphic toxin-type HINT domain-containing protein n=1 Tax=Micromonospora citrea TaxID=47855 RepID=UPI003C50CAAE